MTVVLSFQSLKSKVILVTPLVLPYLGGVASASAFPATFPARAGC
jgi:hypothetical protein